MYYPSTNAILYVVDSKDKQRFSKSAEELSKVLNVILQYKLTEINSRSSALISFS